jgi:hypothetical protein
VRQSSQRRHCSCPLSAQLSARDAGTATFHIASRTPRGIGAAAVASFLAAVLTEIYLCSVCSCQEILRRNDFRSRFQERLARLGVAVTGDAQALDW